MTDAAVMLDHLTVRYGKLTAVADVSLGIPKGCVYALLGRNGSGKSSIVRCLTGQLRHPRFQKAADPLTGLEQ